MRIKEEEEGAAMILRGAVLLDTEDAESRPLIWKSG
jgi:hypothetical protein